MRGFSEQGRFVMGQKLEADRLETPAMAGYRRGLSSSGVIGRKLGGMYHVPADAVSAIESLLRALERKLGQR